MEKSPVLTVCGLDTVGFLGGCQFLHSIAAPQPPPPYPLFRIRPTHPPPSVHPFPPTRFPLIYSTVYCSTLLVYLPSITVQIKR